MRKIFAIVGIILFVASLLVVNILKTGEKKAIALDDQKSSYGIIASDIPPCTWRANPPEKVIAENRTEALSIDLQSPKDSECETVLALRAPGFTISPSKGEQTVNLPPGKTGSVSWILSPLKTGTYEISVSDQIDTKIFGITVNNIFGLTSLQAKIASFVGSIFGPMLTVPWWWDRIRKKKENQVNQGNQDKQVS